MISRLAIGAVALVSMLEFAPPDAGKQNILPTISTVSVGGVPEQNTRPLVVAPIPTTSVPETAPEGPMRADYQQAVTVPLVGPDAPCQQWVPLAVSVGWQADRVVLEKLVAVMWRESRCNVDSWNQTDPNGGSRGLLQINGFWCQPSRYWPTGYLQAHGILGNCDDLFDPTINLMAGLALYNYSFDRHDGNGWNPWKI